MAALRFRTLIGLIVVPMLIMAQGLAQTPQTPQAPQAPELRRTSLEEDVVRTISHISGDVYHAQTNRSGTAFLVTSEGIILADPLSRDFAQWLKEEFAMRFGVPVRYVVYSHYHWDHGSGGEVFADTAEFVGHANMLSYLEMPPPTTTLADVVGQYEPIAALDSNGDGIVEFSETPEDMQRFPGSTQNIFEGFDANRDGELNGAEVVRGPISFVHPPTIRYGDELEIGLGGKRVRLTWMGNMNHSSDTSLITFPDDGVMLIVDYVSRRLPNREMDYELGGFPEWMEAIARTEEMAMDYDYVLTGHGPVGTWDNVRDWREYLEDLRDAVAAGIAAGRTLEELQRTVTMDEYSHWESFEWVDENVLGMYHFLTD